MHPLAEHKCKTREKCIQTEQPCDLPALIR